MVIFKLIEETSEFISPLNLLPSIFREEWMNRLFDRDHSVLKSK
jgi:hypothetical protein